jgi:ectoine hydroxylase-related dioxygenase (phytanoyl-CoA dioxygenase family)
MIAPVIATHAHVRAYVDDGFVVIPNVFTPDEIDIIIAEIPKFARGEYPAMNPQDLPAADHPAPETAILAVHFPHWVSTVIADTIVQSQLVACVTSLAGAHLHEWNGAAKCMQSMLFMKPPGLQGQAWHQDERYIPTRDRSLMGAWIALDDATIDNGCLWVLPGSHRSGFQWPTRVHDDPEEFDRADEAFGFDDGDAISVEVERGSVVFFNGYLLHRSLRNRSDRPRRALVHHYCNAYSPLHWDPANGRFADKDWRIVVPVGPPDPYAHRGYEDAPPFVYIRPPSGPSLDTAP